MGGFEVSAVFMVPSVQEATRAVTGLGECGVKGQMDLVFLKEKME